LWNGIGGVLGCILAGFMMERYHPRNAFLLYGVYSLVVGIACFFLSSNAELNYIPGEKEIITEWSSEVLAGQTPSEAAAARQAILAARPPRGEEGFWHNFKKNMRIIWDALKRREVYFIILYFILDGFTNPSFSDFSYFFLMNVVGVSKFMFAMITLIG
jgi:MFS family permease